jgi:methyl-accepting chemotaxis protein
MDSNSLIFGGTVIAIGVLAIAVIYRLPNRAITLRLSAILVSCLVLASFGGFILGKWITPLAAVIIAPLLALLIAASLIFSRRTLVASLHKTSYYIQGIAEGDLSQEFDKNVKDELGEVADTLPALSDYLQGIARIAEKIGNGDLTDNVVLRSEQDQLGKALNQMVVNLRNILGEVTEHVESMSKSAGKIAASADQANLAVSQIASTIQQVSSGVTDQTKSASVTASAIEQVSQAIDGVAKGAQEQASAVGIASTITSQINTIINRVVENAQAGVTGTVEAAHVAKDSQTTVEATIKGMQQIRSSTLKVKDKVGLMGQRSDQIGVIVETIDDIASQTNLLALNAAIEAARAGEQGKGFAVVADEVRKLAEKSANATKEIGGLVKGIQQVVAETVDAMDAEVNEVEDGTRRADQAGQALTAILKAVERVTSQVEVIASAANEMNSRAGELAGAMDTVSAVVEENTAATEEMAASATEVTRSIENIASVSEENSAAIEEVSASASEVSLQIEQVTSATQNLSDLSALLHQKVMKFTLTKTKANVARGIGLRARLDFVVDRYGQAALERVLQRLDPSEQSVLRGQLRDDGEYPTEVLMHLGDAIKDVVGGGKKEFLREMTAHRSRNFDMQPGGDLHQYHRAGDPGFAMRRMDLVMRHNWGQGVISRVYDLGERHIRLEIDHQKKQPRDRCEFNVPGWMDGAIEAAGGIPNVKHTRCMHDGSPFCEYDVQWEIAKNVPAATQFVQKPSLKIKA